jgi:replicative DNA helicase
METQDPPYDLDAEASVLGGMMLDEAAIDLVEPIIPRGEAGRFYRMDHQLIYAAMVNMRLNDERIDEITLTDYLRSRGELEQVGGKDYLIDLYSAVPSIANVEYYARIVRDKGRLRDLIQLGHRVYNAGYVYDADPGKLAGDTEEALMRIQGAAETSAPVTARKVGEVVVRKILAGEMPTGLKTGLDVLDKRMIGLMAGEVIVLASRPGVGKTALAVQTAEYVAESQAAVLYFSMEMTKEALVRRIAAQRLMIPGGPLRQPKYLSNFDKSKLKEARFSDRLFLSDATGLNTSDIRARARRMKMKQPDLGLIVIDYLGLIHDEGEQQNRNVAVANITRAIKAMALELSIPVLLLHSLSRSSQHENRMPDLHDLRDSGQIEHDADIVWFLHPAKKYDGKSAIPETVEIYLLIRKHREGSVGNVRLKFRRAMTKFIDPDRQEQPTLEGVA